MLPKKRSPGGNNRDTPASRSAVSLKELAEHLGLSPTSLSLVLNYSPQASSIPQETKARIFAAAEEFNYQIGRAHV